MSFAEVENQVSAPKTQGFLKRFKWYITIALFAIGAFASVGTAWGLGAFERGDKKTKTHQTDTKNQVTIQQQTPLQEWKLNPNIKLKDLSKEDFEKYYQELQTKKSNNTLGNLASVCEMFERQKFIWELREDMNLEQCTKLIEIHQDSEENKSKYNFSEDHLRVMKEVLEKCDKKKKEETEKEKQRISDDDPHKALKEFLGQTGMTLKTLLDASNADVLAASFNALNNENDSNKRKTALGTYLEAFESLFNALVTNPSADTKELLEFVIEQKNAEKLGLTVTQTGKIREILEELKKPTEHSKPEKTLAEKAAETFAAATFGQPIDTTGLDEAQLTELEKVIARKIIAEGVKYGHEDSKVTVNEFLNVLKLQKMLKYSESLKLQEADIEKLNSKYEEKLSECDKKINAAFRKVAENAEKYRSIYDIIAAEKEAEKKAKLSGEAIDIACSKAIIDQGSLPKEVFEKNSYQTLCLALSAHILLRDQLKSSGMEAGLDAPKIEKATIFLGIGNRFDLLSNWNPKSIKNFGIAITKAYSQYLNELSSQAVISKKMFFVKQSDFVKNLTNFLDLAERVLIAANDECRQEILRQAIDATEVWDKRIQRDVEFLTEAKTIELPDDAKGIISYGLRLDMEAIIKIIIGPKFPNKEHIMTVLKLALKFVKGEQEIADLKALICFLSFRMIASGLTEKVLNSISIHTLADKSSVNISLNNKIELIDAMAENNELRDAAKALGEIMSKSDLPRYVAVATGYSKLGLTNAILSTKVSELKAECATDLKKTFTNDDDVKFIDFVFGGNNSGDMRLTMVLNFLSLGDDATSLALKKKIAICFALWLSLHSMPSIPDEPVTDDSAFKKFVSTDNRAFISSVFAYEYIEKTRNSNKKFEIVTKNWTSIVGKKVWKRSNWNFSLFNTQMAAINDEMDECARKHGKVGFIDDETVMSFIRKYEDPVKVGQDAYRQMRKNLLVWALKTTFPKA